MEMKISDIKGQKRNPNRYSVFVNGKYSFSLDSNTINREGLHVGKDIGDDTIEFLVRKDEFYRARDYGYLLLSYRDRSVREMGKRLLEKKYHSYVVDEVIEFFKGKNLINDRIFAEKWLDNILESRPMGMMRARHELRLHMVQDEIIDEVVQEKLSFETEVLLAKNAAAKKIKALRNYPADTARNRMRNFLKNRGFRWDIIGDLLKEHFGDDIG
jgi:regulatory protein